MTEKRNYKVWRATREADGGFMVTPQTVFMIGDQKNFIAASKDGLAMVGKSISMGTTSENLRQGGLFINMNDFLRMIPPTIVTPQPQQIPFPPMGMITGILDDLPFFFAMLS